MTWTRSRSTAITDVSCTAVPSFLMSRCLLHLPPLVRCFCSLSPSCPPLPSSPCACPFQSPLLVPLPTSLALSLLLRSGLSLSVSSSRFQFPRSLLSLPVPSPCRLPVSPNFLLPTCSPSLSRMQKIHPHLIPLTVTQHEVLVLYRRFRTLDRGGKVPSRLQWSTAGRKSHRKWAPASFLLFRLS